MLEMVAHPSSNISSKNREFPEPIIRMESSFVIYSYTSSWVPECCWYQSKGSRTCSRSFVTSSCTCKEPTFL